jgi:hypothetical protein
MFTALLITALVGIIGAAAYVGVRNARGSELAGKPDLKQLTDGAPDKLLVRTVRDLRVGDVVTHDGREYLVEGAIHYDEAGHRWVAGRLVDIDAEKWLLVGMERAGADTVRIADIADIEVSGYPPETMVVDGTRYNLDKRGTATAKASGETDVLDSTNLSSNSVQRCRWWRYEGTGGKCLIIEQWGDAFRTLRGETIRISDLEMLPGS